MKDISILIKPASGLCNMDCGYCFYHDEAKNREKESYGLMDIGTLESIIKKSITVSEEKCSILFQGGEPVIRGLDFFKEVIRLEAYYKEYYGKKNYIFHNAIQTNGTLLDEEWVDFLKTNNFLVGISLDGNMFTHDFYRKDKEGNGTFERVLKGISLLKEYGVEFNILTVVNAVTVKKISKIYSFYKEMDFPYLQFIPCINPLNPRDDSGKAEFGISAEKYGHFLKELFDLWYRDLKNGRVMHIQLFEEYIRMLLLQQPGVCGMAGVCTYQHVIEADGMVYPCDFYVLDQYRLGNINLNSFEEINKKREELRFIEESIVVNEKCKKCKYYPLCRGGCKRYRQPEHIFCESFYNFFEYSIKRLEEAAALYR